MSIRKPKTIVLWQGDTLNQLYTVTDLETDEVKDLEGASGEYSIGATRNGDASLTGSTTMLTPAGNGKLRVTRANIQLDPGQYYLQVAVTDGDGIVSTVAEDILLVHASLNN